MLADVSDTVEATTLRDQTEENFEVVRELLTATANLLQQPGFIVADVDGVG